MEPFSSVGLQAEDFTWIFATTTKICTEGCSTSGYPLASLQPSRRSSYSPKLIIRAPAKAPGCRSDGGVSVACLSAIHFRGRFIRQVSCYTLLSGCRLPWPPSCCLNESTPFLGSSEHALWHLNPCVWFIPHRHSCLPGLAHLGLAPLGRGVQL